MMRESKRWLMCLCWCLSWCLFVWVCIQSKYSESNHHKTLCFSVCVCMCWAAASFSRHVCECDRVYLYVHTHTHRLTCLNKIISIGYIHKWYSRVWRGKKSLVYTQQIVLNSHNSFILSCVCVCKLGECASVWDCKVLCVCMAIYVTVSVHLYILYFIFFSPRFHNT